MSRMFDAFESLPPLPDGQPAPRASRILDLDSAGVVEAPRDEATNRQSPDGPRAIVPASEPQAVAGGARARQAQTFEDLIRAIALDEARMNL